MVEKLEKFMGWIIAAVAILLITLIFVINSGSDQEFSVKYAGFDLSGASTGRTNTYPRYMERHAGALPGQKDIPIDIFRWSAGEGVSVINFRDIINEWEAKGVAIDRGENINVIRAEETGFIEYTVNVEQAGFYFFHIDYFPLPSRGIPVERALYINGEVPFLGADRLSFLRVWGDGRSSRDFDNQGNQIRPSQVEKPRWESSWFRDSLGYVAEPYSFYLNAGANRIRLVGINEPVAIRSLSIRVPVQIKSYSEYIASIDKNRYKNTRNNYLIKVQGEKSSRRSDPSLYPIYDRSSGATEPASVAKIRLNMIGGQSWRVSGQWIEWEFDVPESGMYRISIKGRQNYNRGYVSNRTIMINGEVPVQELSAVPFRYNNKWVLSTLGNEDHFYFPMEAGTNTVRMQATLGGMGDMLSTMEESVYRLNSIYRKILVLTGPEPDIYRDYRVEKVYPEIIEAMKLESKILYKLVDDLTRYSGERSAQAAATLTLARQLEFFVKRPDRIPRTLVNFKQNISSLGDSLLALSQSQLDIDYIVISASDSTLPKINENFLVAASHEIRSFFMSFFVNYNDLGDRFKESDDVIEVWILAGRDQSTILKAMIDDTFTPMTVTKDRPNGIRVNVKLVAPDAVMPAVVAGT
ncbi:MAG: hypothetical protein LBG94_10880, partial [Treponema sp.]|nr:hypothetical protein [Treponema sp.]